MNLPQRSLAGGELSPSLHARTDLQKYASGVKTMRNFQIMRSGGVDLRNGQKFIVQAKNQDKKVRLIPFVHPSAGSVILEFGHNYIRPIIVTTIGEINDYLTGNAFGKFEDCVSATVAAPCVFTVAAHTFVDGDQVCLWNDQTSEIGLALGQYRYYKVSDKALNTFTLTYIDGPLIGQKFSSVGLSASGLDLKFASVEEIVTTYAEADLFDLQYVQSGNVMTITHPGYAVKTLTLTAVADNAYTYSFGSAVFAPGIAAPTGLASSGTGESGNAGTWVVTSVADETFEESLPATHCHSAADATTLTWNAVSGAREYNVYKQKNGVYGLVYVTGTNSWVIEGGIEPTMTETPPIARNPFSTYYPSVVNYIQQRLAMGASDQHPETLYLSRTGFYKNFTTRSPIQDDDAVTFTMAGRQLNRIQHILDLGKLVILTQSGEWVSEGGGDGVLTPFAINLKQQSYYGASSVRPVVIGKDAVYVQARTTAIRTLGYSYEVDGYTGNDLTIFSNHLFDKQTIVEMAHQQMPHSILWVVMADGSMLGMTYVKEHQIFGWHRHDTDGEYESVCSLPLSGGDSVFYSVKRTINGQTFRFIEQQTNLIQRDVEDFIYLDASASEIALNGGPGSTVTETGSTIKLTSAGTWTYLDDITITRTSGGTVVPFTAASITGKEIHIVGTDGEKLRLRDLVFVSDYVITGKPHKTVPAAMKNVNLADWTVATNTVTGLWHLEGEAVAVFADGFVVANPNNPSMTTVTVSSGVITLDRCYSKIHVGLPYICDLETLDIDSPQGQSLVENKKLINKVNIAVESSRGIWVGPEFPTGTDATEGMREARVRNVEGYDDPVALTTGNIEVPFESFWSTGGRVCIRQIDPVPLKILAVIPSGFVAGGR